MNLHLLRMFTRVVELQGFSRAALALHVSQSAVSKAVRELEAQLELPLIERGSGGKGARGVQLTDSGRALYGHARAIFAMERIAVEDVRDRVGLRQGGLRIGASTTVAGYWLPASIARFATDFPALRLELLVANTEETSKAIIDCRVDVAFVEGTVDDPRIVAALWQHEPLALVVARDAALGGTRPPTSAELGRQAWLVRETGSGTRQAAQAFLAARGIVPRALIEIGSNEAIARAVAFGAGVALLPTVVVEELIAIDRVRRVDLGKDRGLHRPLYRLELANRPRSPALRAFLDILPTP